MGQCMRAPGFGVTRDRALASCVSGLRPAHTRVRGTRASKALNCLHLCSLTRTLVVPLQHPQKHPCHPYRTPATEESEFQGKAGLRAKL